MNSNYLFPLITLFSLPFSGILWQTTFEISEDITFDFTFTILKTSGYSKSLCASKRSGDGKIKKSSHYYQ